CELALNNLDPTLKSVEYADSKQYSKRKKAHTTPSQSKTAHQPPQASFMLLHSTAGNQSLK
ncbi:hypothetical protein ACQP3F_30085, partial [Escherichia coli]